MTATYTPNTTAVGGSLWLTALIAMLPLATIFVTLGALRWKAYKAGLTAIAVAILVAILAFGMPIHLAFLAASEGAVFGLFPITWIVLTAIWLYQVTVVSGRFEDLRGTFNLVSDDPRVTAILIAFCFGGLMEALAGFGAPVAITGVMLMAVGFSALRAAMIVLVANTAPVAFGAIATPIITAGTLTGIDYHHIGAYVGRQTPVLASLVPLLLVFLADGMRGLKQTWPVALVVGVTFGIAQFVSANHISVELTDIIASLVGLAAGVIMLRFWQPAGREEAIARLHGELDREQAELGLSTPDAGGAGGVATMTKTAVAQRLTSARIGMALFPYLLVIAVFSLAKLWGPFKTFLANTDRKIHWPGLDGQIVSKAGKPSSSTIYNFQWLSSPGTLLLICGIIVALVYRVPLSRAAKEFGATVVKMRFSMLTIASVLALAYVMNLSGQTITIGTWIAGTGAAFAFLSPILGWIGTAVTGSDTSANALFATLQQTAAEKAGIDPTLLVAANTAGGVVGKMISPQNLTIAATAVGLLGQESLIFRKVVWWSVGLLAILCLLIGLQSTALSWMLP
ncbi:MAG: L-lactate permease [Tetrasphaera sp.]|nr:L-lactate permease [Tetrasphaera sp.]